MQFDKLFYFGVFSNQQHQNLAPYFSPENENSLFKNVPVDRMAEFKQIARSVFPQARIRVRFRGHRHDGMRLTTLKRDAQRVTIYADLV